MKITLTTKELEHAIACYLRANAAVVVGDMTFSLKKSGIETVVETTVKEIEPAEEVIPRQLELDLGPVRVTSLPPTMAVPYIGTPEVETFEHNPEELLDEGPEEIEQETEDDMVHVPWVEPSTEIEVVSLELDSLIESETVEEMPVVNSMSIADILGS